MRGTAGRVSAARFRHVALLGLAPWSLVRVAAPALRAGVSRLRHGGAARPCRLRRRDPGARLVDAPVAGAFRRRRRPGGAGAGLAGPAGVRTPPRPARPVRSRSCRWAPCVVPGSTARRRAAPAHVKASWLEPIACVVGSSSLAWRSCASTSGRSSPILFRSAGSSRGVSSAMKPGVHETYRAILRAAIAREVVDACRRRHHGRRAAGPPRARCRERARRRRRRGARHPRPEDLVFRAFVRFFMGVAPDSDAVPRLRALYHVIDFRNPTGASDVAIVSALEEIQGVIRRQLAVWAAPPGGETPPRAVLAELQRTAPACLDDTTVVRNLIYMLRTGVNDISGLLDWVLKILSDHPAWAARLRRSSPTPVPKRRASRDRSRTGLSWSACGSSRASTCCSPSATGDIRFGGYLIPEGVARAALHAGRATGIRPCSPTRTGSTRTIPGEELHAGGVLAVRPPSTHLHRRPPDPDGRPHLRDGAGRVRQHGRQRPTPRVRQVAALDAELGVPDHAHAAGLSAGTRGSPGRVAYWPGRRRSRSRLPMRMRRSQSRKPARSRRVTRSTSRCSRTRAATGCPGPAGRTGNPGCGTCSPACQGPPGPGRTAGHRRWA